MPANRWTLGTALCALTAGTALFGKPAAIDDATAIRRLVVDSTQACLSGPPEAALAVIDPEARLSHPNSPDQTYTGFATDYSNLCRKDGVLESSVPNFEEVTVNGAIAVVRIEWSRHFRDMAPGTTRQVHDLQIWRKTLGGWRLWRGVNWPARAAAQ